MIEARAFLDSLDAARAVLERQNASFRGGYTIHDTIFRRRDSSVSLIQEFLRLRVIPENIWGGKAVTLAVKQTTLQTLGKTVTIPTELPFDTREEAESYYKDHLQAQYVEDFSFSRVGWQYTLPDSDVVDLEVIEDRHPSIEIKSKTGAGIAALAELFIIPRDAFITGPSVVAVRGLLDIV